jgi:predicted nucleotidyltransferase
MMQSEQILPKLQQLASQNADIAAIRLYGSRVNGRARQDSDDDLAVAFRDFSLDPMHRYTRPHTLALDWAAALSVPAQLLSVVDMNQAPIYLAYQIIDTGQLIYNDNSARAWQEISRINSLFEYQQRETQR